MWWSHTCSTYRRDLDELRKHSPKLAEDLDRIGGALDADDQPNYHALYEEWEQHIRQVRQLPKFEYFICPLPISELLRATNGGQALVINDSAYRPDALILRAANNLTHIRIRSSTIMPKLRRIEFMQWHPGQEPRNLRGMRRVGTNHTTDLNDILYQIRSLIGEPVVGDLKILGVLESNSVSKPRVWWCLPPDWLQFFPVHASCPGDVHAAGMMDFVVSSYTPTLSLLLRPHHLSKFHMLTVGQPVCEGQLPLDNVTSEMEAMHNHLSSDQTSFLSGQGATVHTVSSALSTCTWAHFACHGYNHEQPMESSLIMHHCCAKCPENRRVCILFNMPICTCCCMLAILGIIWAIATMWSVEDECAFTVARQFYAELFQDSVTDVTAANAALALNQACCHVRDRDEVPLDYWASYVHFGHGGI